MTNQSWIEEIENALLTDCDKVAEELAEHISARAANNQTDMRDIALCLVAINDTLGYIRSTIDAVARNAVDA